MVALLLRGTTQGDKDFLWTCGAPRGPLTWWQEAEGHSHRRLSEAKVSNFQAALSPEGQIAPPPFTFFLPSLFRLDEVQRFCLLERKL